jgi:hypothetical protein
MKHPFQRLSFFIVCLAFLLAISNCGTTIKAGSGLDGPSVPRTDVIDTAPEDSAILAWDANTESSLKGYRVYYGTRSTQYDLPVQDVGLTDYPDEPLMVVKNLSIGKTYYFAVTAYDNSGNESIFSEEVSKQIN